MDSILQKFYNGGNTSINNGFTQFGALQSNATRPIGLSHTSKSPLPVRPLINSVSTTYNKPSLTIDTNFNKLVTNKDFLRPKNLAFNSSSDLIYNNPGNVQRRYNSEYNIRKDTYADIKRNDTKMQMMEEKMKNLELKSQRLEVINDFFFDMFENNLVKEEINKQREQAAKMQKQKMKEEGYEVSSSSDSESETESVSNNKRKNKNKKKQKKNFNLNTYDINNLKKKEEFDPIKYQKSKMEYNKQVLDNIKKNVSDYLFEEELKKNEQLQIMGENINELKSKLVSKIDKMEMMQQHQLEKVMFCLINSSYVDDLPSHIFESPVASPYSNRKDSIRRRASMSRNNQVPNRTIILKQVANDS